MAQALHVPLTCQPDPTTRCFTIFDATTSLAICGNDNAPFKVTMSFGFGVGDFITVLQLANKIRERFVDAPEQFEAISDE